MPSHACADQPTSGYPGEVPAPRRPAARRGVRRPAPPPDPRYEHWEQRLTIPVVVAALASVPAVFLTLLDGVYETVGLAVNYAAGAVLVAETVVLAVLARDLRAWARQHRWLIALTALMVPAVVFAVGPVQLLRLVHLVGALRFARAGRIIRASNAVRRRAGLRGWRGHLLSGSAGLLVAVFVAVVFADPTSASRQLLDQALQRGGRGLFVAIVITAGLVLAASTYVVARSRLDERDGAPGEGHRPGGPSR
jgi:hypothetical protein